MMEIHNTPEASIQVAQPSATTALEGVAAYINAGGRGTRLNSVFVADQQLGISKALIEIGTPPITLVEHQVNRLQQAAFSSIIVGAGDHYNVADHIASTYAEDPAVQAVYTPRQLGNGGDLLQALRLHDELFGNQVLIGNVDSIVDIDERDFVDFHISHSGAITIALTQNKGVPNQDAFLVNQHGQILHSRESAHNPVDLEEAAKRTNSRGSSTGMLVIDILFLESIKWQPADGPLSIYRDIIGQALVARSMYSYDNGTKAFMDVGTVNTWNRLQQEQAFWQKYICYGNQATD